MMNELYAGIFLIFGGISMFCISMMMITGCERLDPIFHKYNMNNIFLVGGIVISLFCLMLGSRLIVESIGWYII